ncbi:hypothetical protein [Methylobacterium platani]|uniref:Uncharacterized protein n=2 Tax=Methylobacterium platani TaxID=427683 RepID=A0A179SET0_9HYPH|nr:hypothetical protein [Methylobacterium platani]KMO21387.1 hypothetical protein SQ03_03265 [Methylobacterium platani JCM 14648]OAS26338.1 hypothetical protein A5481_06380 [Methylobacterium platani]
MTDFTEADFRKAWRLWRLRSGVVATTGARDDLLEGIRAQAQARQEGRTIPRPPCPARDAVLRRAGLEP